MVNGIMLFIIIMLTIIIPSPSHKQLTQCTVLVLANVVMSEDKQERHWKWLT